MFDSSFDINEDLLNDFSQTLPCFPVDQSCIEILESPAHFYETLLDEIENSREKISMSSLYIGTGEREKALVHKLYSRLSSTENLTTNLLFDYHRAQRIDSTNSSSLTILNQILRDSCLKERVRLYLYRCPQYRLYHDLCLDMRWKEIIGVQHTKLYVFDDTVIISGANLSQSYFVNRSDRYYKLKDRNLAICAHSLISKIGEASYLFDSDSKFLDPPKSSLQHDSFSRNESNLTNASYHSNKGTWVFPAMQLGIARLHQDETALFAALRAFDSPDASITFASGYLNMTPQLQRRLLNLKAIVNILTASPSANGFYNAQGIARHIPNVYSSIQAQILTRSKQPEKLRMAEFNRPGWTYHEKGIWIQPRKYQAPILTAIGSSNFGYRSTRRDLECQFYIVSSDPEMRSRWRKEMEESMRHMSPVTPETFRLYPERRLSFGIQLVSRLIRTWL